MGLIKISFPPQPTPAEDIVNRNIIPARDFPRTRLVEAINNFWERYHRGEFGVDDFGEEFMKLHQQFPRIGWDVAAAEAEHDRQKRTNKEEGDG